MKKVIVSILSVLLLSGCTVKTNINLQEELESALIEGNSETIYQNNMNKKLYSYYLPTSIGRNYSTQCSSILNDRGRKFIMNLNIAAIIQGQYYNESENSFVSDLNSPIAQSSGEYVDTNEKTHSYEVSIYEINGYYISIFSSDTVEFYSVLDALSSCEIIKDMLMIARSINVDKNAVLKKYSNKNTVDYKSEKIELFEQIVPESGRIEELFEDTQNDGEDTTEKNEDGPKQITNTDDVSE